ncbi:MAG: DUF4238 domain-containing protein [Chitinophagaceae bacterium]|nr:MAG: DUF4238 domain-containing protein [Chitinophagaceae bacterium]
MNTEKKNQHYIPKFYLRNFSFNGNQKQIGLFNIENEVFIRTAKLKTQGSKNFFYGYDGVVEDSLANIEGHLSGVLKDIISNRSLPTKGGLKHFELLLFVTITDLRNPVKIESMKASFSEMRRQLLTIDPKADVEKLVPNPSHEHLVRTFLSGSVEMAEMISDLNYKLLVNKTSKPFISSNFPVVKYNQFLEGRKWPHSKSGYGLVGLKIFIPLNHELMLMFYDNGIYKAGDRKKEYLDVTNEKNVDDINILQYLNCLDTIYFDHKASEAYVRQLHAKASKFKRANQTRSELGFLIKEDDSDNKRVIESGQKNFLQINKSDCETKLEIEGLKIHSKGKSHQLNNTLAQLRPHAAKVRNGGL